MSTKEKPRTPAQQEARRAKRKAGLPGKFRAGFLSTMDGRTDLARCLRDNYKNIVADIGGPDEIGHVKSSLIERFVWLEAILQTLEQEMATDTKAKSEGIGRWIQAVNALSGLAKVLGIERRINRPWVLDAATNPATNGATNGAAHGS